MLLPSSTSHIKLNNHIVLSSKLPVLICSCAELHCRKISRIGFLNHSCQVLILLRIVAHLAAPQKLIALDLSAYLSSLLSVDVLEHSIVFVFEQAIAGKIYTRRFRRQSYSYVRCLATLVWVPSWSLLSNSTHA